MSKDIHRSKELDKYLGQVVKITFIRECGGDEQIGVLGYETKYSKGRYNLDGGVHFRKTHIKKVELMSEIKGVADETL